MFRALNLYKLIEVEAVPITDIHPAATPEKTVVTLDPSREENRGRERLEVSWPELCRLHYKAQINGRERVVTVPDVLIEFLTWVKKETANWKTVPLRPWDTASPVASWLSPYLRVSSPEELQSALADDLALLKNMRRQYAEKDG